MTEIAQKSHVEEGTREQAPLMYQKSQTAGPTLAFSPGMSQDEIRNDELGLTAQDESDLTGSAARMRHAISAASIGSGSREELEMAARQLVMELRNANEPPEQVLLAMKRILALAGLRPGHPPTDPAMIIE